MKFAQKTKINIPNFQNSALHWYFYVPLRPEPIFVNVLGVPELIPDSQCGSPNATKESPGHVLLSNNCMYSIFLWSFLFLTVFLAPVTGILNRFFPDPGYHTHM